MSRILSRYGSLSEDRLAELIRGICLDRKSGVLHLFNKEMSKRLYFNRGSIVFAGSDVDEDRLGEVLIREGKVKRSDLDFVWQVMKRTGQGLAETLVEMEFLSPEEIRAQSVRRMKAIIYSAFTWTSGKYRFEELENPVDEDVAMNMAPAGAIMEGIRRIQDPVIIRNILGDLKGVIRQPNTAPLPYDEENDFTPQEIVVMDLARVCMDGASTAADLAAMSPLGENETLQCICSLVSVGALELEKPPAVPASAERPASSEKPTRSGGGTPAPEASPTPPLSTLRFGASSLPKRLGRYEIQDLLGRGSMGTVFSARDPAIGRVVAIKLIQNAMFFTARERERYRNRFRREAKAAGKLVHPGIVTVFDFGYADEESPFIVMEYVQGPTLQEILQENTLSPEETMQIAHELLDALGYAHSLGIVHRDIKPANILVTPGLHTKIMDFGIAHVIGSQLTPTDHAMGSPNYMAPEQLSKGTIDQRTDLFAFGVVLYRVLTGRLPFTGDSFAANAQAILAGKPATPDSINPAVSPSLAGIVLRCLAKDPAGRFASAEEIKQALTSDTIDHLLLEVESKPFPESVFLGKTGERKRPAPAEMRGDATAVDDLAGTVPFRSPWGVAVRPARTRFFHAALVIPLVLGVIFTLSLLFFPRGKASLEQTGAVPSPDVGRELGEERELGDQEGSPGQEQMTDGKLVLEADQGPEPQELEASEAKSEEQPPRSPSAAGASEQLARVNDGLKGEKQNPRTGQDSEDEGSPRQPVERSEPQLFYEARLALEGGDLETSTARLEELLRRNPSFAGASELLVEVRNEVWKQTLPIPFHARHRHRIGDCTGTLLLAVDSIRYSSEEHEWNWPFEEIRVLERTDRETLTIETSEKDILGMGKPKRYRLTLTQPLDEENWNRYRTVVK